MKILETIIQITDVRFELIVHIIPYGFPYDITESGVTAQLGGSDRIFGVGV